MSSKPSTPSVAPLFGGPPDSSEQVALLIQRDLEQRGLRPGDRVGTEHELAARFGVSRPTLREALRVLASAQLIRSRQGPGGGIFVANTPKEGMRRHLSRAIAGMLETDQVSLEDLLETRLFLEVPLAGRAAANATPAAIERMDAAIAVARDHPVASDAFREADAEFHRAIAQAAGLELLTAFTSWTLDVLQPSLVSHLAEILDADVVLEQHLAIARAIRRGQSRAAERAMRTHLEHMRVLLARSAS